MKTDIKRIDSLTHNDTAATKNINDNFAALQAGIEDSLSRTGKTPNFMDAELDMNTYRIINVGDAVDDTDVASYGQMKKGVERAEAAASKAETSEAKARQYASDARNSRDTAEQIVEKGKKDLDEAINEGKRKVEDAADEGVRKIESAADGYQTVDNMVTEILEGVEAGKYPNAQAVIDYVTTHGGSGGGGDSGIIIHHFDQALAPFTYYTSNEIIGGERSYSIYDISSCYSKLKEGVNYKVVAFLYNPISVGLGIWMNDDKQLWIIEHLSKTTSNATISDLIFIPIDSVETNVTTNGTGASTVYSSTSSIDVLFHAASWENNEGTENIPAEYTFKNTAQTSISFAQLDYLQPVIDVVFDTATALSGNICPTVTFEVIKNSWYSELKITTYAKEKPSDHLNATVRLTFGRV